LKQIQLSIKDFASHSPITTELTDECDATTSNCHWPAEFAVAMHEPIHEAAFIAGSHLVCIAAKAMIPTFMPASQVPPLSPLEYHKALHPLHIITLLLLIGFASRWIQPSLGHSSLVQWACIYGFNLPLVRELQHDCHLQLVRLVLHLGRLLALLAYYLAEAAVDLL